MGEEQALYICVRGLPPVFRREDLGLAFHFLWADENRPI
jgi:hypothetical protein